MEPVIGTEALNKWLQEQQKLTKMSKEERETAIEVKDLRKGRFYWIKNEILEKIAPVTGVYGVAVYNILAYFANGYSRKSFPSITKMASLLGCSRPEVIEALSKLESLGVIEVERRPGRVNIYKLIDERKK